MIVLGHESPVNGQNSHDDTWVNLVIAAPLEVISIVKEVASKDPRLPKFRAFRRRYEPMRAKRTGLLDSGKIWIKREELAIKRELEYLSLNRILRHGRQILKSMREYKSRPSPDDARWIKVQEEIITRWLEEDVQFTPAEIQERWEKRTFVRMCLLK